MLVRSSQLALTLLAIAAPLSLEAQSPAVLYTWQGTGNTQKWFRNFGTNTVTLTNDVDGELTITETGAPGSGVAISDDFNSITERGIPINAFMGGIDLTGLSSLELDLGHNGVGPVNIQFFVQASSASTFVALGPDVAVGPAMSTYSLPLSGLIPEQIAYIRTIGINIRDHLIEGNLVWTLREVRSAGVPLASRDFATHEPGSSDGGLQGAIVNFENAAVEGSDGGQNQSGLSHNAGAAPPGNTGSLRWVDLAAGNGAAIAWFNGTALNGNSYNERPTDMSNYSTISVRLAATNRGGSVASVDVQYYLQTANFTFQAAGGDLTLPADGAFHELEFPLSGVQNLDLVDIHGINLRAHADGDLIIDVDSIRAARPISGSDQRAGDCNQDGAADIADVVCYLKVLLPTFVLLPTATASPPCGGSAGGNLAVLDVNGDAAVNLADVIYLATYLFGAGSAPVQGTECFPAEGCPANPGC